MVRYNILTTTGDTVELNGDLVPIITRQTLTYPEHQTSWENNIVENSYLPGSVKVGENRLQAKSLVLTYQRVSKDNFVEDENQLLFYLNKAEYLVDVERNIRIKILVETHYFSFDEGGHRVSGMGEITILCLTPYWEDITETVLTGTVLDTEIKDVEISNVGYLKTFPKFTFTATDACSRVQVWSEDTLEGFDIQNSNFDETSGDLVVDCEKGEVTLDGQNIITSLIIGTGFIVFIPEGLDISISSDAELDYEISYKKRYYL